MATFVKLFLACNITPTPQIKKNTKKQELQAEQSVGRLLLSVVNLWQERTSGCGFHICIRATSTVFAALWSHWRAEREIWAVCWHTNAEWLRYFCFYIPVYPITSRGLEIRTCHLHPPKDQMRNSMCKTCKVAASPNFDLLELYLPFTRWTQVSHLVEAGDSFTPTVTYLVKLH